MQVVEFKSQVGSVGNNINNRVEESLGNATDFWASYAEGGFAPSGRPWIGYVLILGDAHDLQNTVVVKERALPGVPEFKNASYAARYNSLLTRTGPVSPLRRRLFHHVLR